MLSIFLAALAAQPLQTPPRQAMWIYVRPRADRTATGPGRLMDQCAPDPAAVRSVLATGARHAYFGRDEWEPFAPGLKTLEDATTIRRKVLRLGPERGAADGNDLSSGCGHESF